MRFSLFIILIISIVSCTTVGTVSFIPETYDNEQEAILYIYRLSNILGSIVKDEITIIGPDKIYSTQITMGGYHAVHIKPGEYILEFQLAYQKGFRNSNSNLLKKITLNVQPLRNYFIKINAFDVLIEDEEQGMLNLARMKKEIYPWYEREMEEWRKEWKTIWNKNGEDI